MYNLIYYNDNSHLKLSKIFMIGYLDKVTVYALEWLILVISYSDKDNRIQAILKEQIYSWITLSKWT